MARFFRALSFFKLRLGNEVNGTQRSASAIPAQNPNQLSADCYCCGNLSFLHIDLPL